MPPHREGSAESAKPKNEMTALQLAERCAAAMFDADRASQAMRMQIDEVGPGYAHVSMRLRPDMINGHRTAHGGAVFSLADSAFAFACNSRNVRSVAQHCSITFVTAGRAGELLVARAQETNLSGRFGIYDVTVTGEDGRLVAVFRGHSAAVRGSVIEE